MLGYEPQSFVPDYNAWARRVHPDDLPKLAAEAQRMLEHPREAFGEYRAFGQNHELRWLEARGRFECDRDGRPKRYYGVLMDITERKRAEERDRILTAEVNHRAKNLLAVVQAVALQTTSEDDPKEFAQNFNDRLAGLAASQDLLVQSHWQGVDTAELVRFQLSHFAGLIGQRILVNGPPAQLKASAAQTLGMAIHELATNASGLRLCRRDRAAEVSRHPGGTGRRNYRPCAKVGSGIRVPLADDLSRAGLVRKDHVPRSKFRSKRTPNFNMSLDPKARLAL
jgi:PAS domain S-box-containing protein